MNKKNIVWTSVGIIGLVLMSRSNIDGYAALGIYLFVIAVMKRE